eukprot:10548810-Alexandrium_andersonii.AAC.1
MLPWVRRSPGARAGALEAHLSLRRRWNAAPQSPPAASMHPAARRGPLPRSLPQPACGQARPGWLRV